MFVIKYLLLASLSISANASTFEYVLKNQGASPKTVSLNSEAWTSLPFSNVVSVSFPEGKSQLTMPPYFEGKVAVSVTANETLNLRDPSQVINLSNQGMALLEDWLVQYPGYRYRQGYELEDCNGAARLLVEVARRAGYQAQSVTGLVYESNKPGKPFFHAWVKVKIQGEWVDADIFAIDKDEQYIAAAIFGTLPDFKLSELIQ